MQFAGDLFWGVLEASLQASLLAVAAGLLLWVLRDRVSPRIKYAAWILVAARLCLPAGLGVPVGSSLPGLRGEPAHGSVTVFRATQDDGAAATSHANPPAVSRAPAVPSSNADVTSLRLEDLLGLAWLAGCAFFAARLLWRASSDRRLIRSLSPARHARLDGTLLASCR